MALSLLKNKLHADRYTKKLFTEDGLFAIIDTYFGHTTYSVDFNTDSMGLCAPHQSQSLVTDAPLCLSLSFQIYIAAIQTFKGPVYFGLPNISLFRL